MPERISIIIPTLNEIETLPLALHSTRQAVEVERIVVDGGSRDGTPDVAAAHQARVISFDSGRGRQMNAGAAAASGEVLLFLHADTRLPHGFDRHVRRLIQEPGVSAGAFRLHIDSAERSLRLIEFGANWRSRWMQAPYGDQAIFVRASLFRQIGGFPDIPIMEDFELVRRLRRRGRISLAPAFVTTSARRWRQLGVWRTTLLNQGAILAYYLGVEPSRIACWYYRQGAPPDCQTFSRL